MGHLSHLPLFVRASSGPFRTIGCRGPSWLWALEPNAFRTLPDSAGARVWAAGFDRSRRPLLVVGDDRSARVWDASGGRAVTSAMQHENRIDRAWIVGSAPYVITQSFVNSPGQRSIPILTAWNATTGQRTASPLEGARLYDPVQVIRDGQRVIVRMDDGQLRAWNFAARSAELMTELPAKVRAVTFTSSGICSALAVGAGDLRISNGVDGTPLGPDLKGVGDAPQVELGPAGAFEQKVTVLNNSLLNKPLTGGKWDSEKNVRFSYCSLRGCFGSKIDQKTHARNQHQVHGAASSFLAGRNRNFRLNAPAGPTCTAVEEMPETERLLATLRDKGRVMSREQFRARVGDRQRTV